MTLLAALLDAQARLDDGNARPGDHDCAQRLEQRCQAAADRVLAIQTVADLDRWRDWHAEHCDDDETCTHYEPMEG